jgi:hypothetical protein
MQVRTTDTGEANAYQDIVDAELWSRDIFEPKAAFRPAFHQRFHKKVKISNVDELAVSATQRRNLGYAFQPRFISCAGKRSFAELQVQTSIAATSEATVNDAEASGEVDASLHWLYLFL